MEFAFYICGLIAILATLRVVTHTNPVHAAVPDYFAAGDCRGVFSRWALTSPVRWKSSFTPGPLWCCSSSW